MTDLTRKAAQAGYCVGAGAYNPTNPIFCSLDPKLCPTIVEYDYRSTLEALNLKISCYFLQDTDSAPLAKCDDDRCAVDEESCNKDGGVLTPLYADDTFDPKCSVKNAIYGNCDGRCVWSSLECQPFETYNLPPTPSLNIAKQDDDCTCDKVKTGGCKKDGSSVLCTVSEASCEYTQTWLTHDEVVEQEGIECYLCREEPTPAPSEISSSSPSVSPPTRSPVKMPVTMPTATSIDTKSSSNDDVKSGGDPNMAAIIGGAVGGAVALSLIIGIVLFRAKRGRGSRAAASPPSDVFVS